MLNSDYKEMLLLQKHDVEFMLIGAYVLAFHGVPRSTGDIDFFVRSSPENSRRVYKALVEFGAPVVGIDELYWSQYDNSFQIGVAPCRIDISTRIDGLKYEEVDTVDAEVDGLVIPVISKIDFIKNKRAAGRQKVLAEYRVHRIRVVREWQQTISAMNWYRGQGGFHGDFLEPFATGLCTPRHD